MAVVTERFDTNRVRRTLVIKTTGQLEGLAWKNWVKQWTATSVKEERITQLADTEISAEIFRRRIASLRKFSKFITFNW